MNEKDPVVAFLAIRWVTGIQKFIFEPQMEKVGSRYFHLFKKRPRPIVDPVFMGALRRIGLNGKNLDIFSGNRACSGWRKLQGEYA